MGKEGRSTPRTKVAGRDDVQTHAFGADDDPTLVLADTPAHPTGVPADVERTVLLDDRTPVRRRPVTKRQHDTEVTEALRPPEFPNDGSTEQAETFYRLPSVLADRYEIIEELGSGGQGVVLRCHDHEDKTDVAIKLLNRGVVGPGADFIGQLRDCDPAHVTPIFDADERGRWEVMEYFAAGTLEQVPRSWWNDETITDFVAQMHAALTHVHGRQILHQDLKPANIFVRSLVPFDVVLGDFGLARQQEVTEQISSTDGTLAYQSPEYALAGRHSAGGDWWALGMIIHILLTGRHVYAGDDGRINGRALRAHLFDGAISLAAVTEPRWRLLLEGLLTAELRDRWGSAEVGQWLEGKSPAVRRRESPSARAARTRHITLLQTVCTTPEEVAAALGSNTGAALDYLRSDTSDELVDWLRRVGLAQEAGEFIAPIRKGRPGAERNLIALQALLDPESSPRFDGRELSMRALLEAADAAADGDRESGAWISRMRKARVLTGAAQLETHAAMAMTDERLRMWWIDIQQRLDRMSGAARELAQHQMGALEGIALAAALSESRLAGLVKSGTTQLRRASHIDDEMLLVVAPRGNDDVVSAMLGILVIPELERRGKAATLEQERLRAKTTSLMKDAEKQRRNIHRKAARRQRRGEHKARFFRRFRLHGLAATVATAAISLFGSPDLPETALTLGVGLALVLGVLTLVDIVTGQALHKLPRRLGLPTAAGTTLFALASSSADPSALTPALALAPPAGWIVGYTLGSAISRVANLLPLPPKLPRWRLGAWVGLLPAFVGMGWFFENAGWLGLSLAQLPDTITQPVRTLEGLTTLLDLPGAIGMWLVAPLVLSIIWLFEPVIWGRFGRIRRWLGLATVLLAAVVALDHPALLTVGLAFGAPLVALVLIVMATWTPKLPPPPPPPPESAPGPLGPPPFA